MPIYAVEGEDPELTKAKAAYGPILHNALVAANFSSRAMGRDKLQHITAALAESGMEIVSGDMKHVELMLASQATSLNVMFCDLANRSALNLANPSYFEAAQRYMAMALKCQNQSRMTMETLATVKNPPVFAKQANVNSGSGQMQVNNGNTSASRASKKGMKPSKVLEKSNEQPVDS